MEKGLITGTEMSYLNQAYGNQADNAANASQMAMDSQEYMGNALGRFKEKVAPNIGYSFGFGGYTDTSDAAKLKEENDLLRSQLGIATGAK